MTPRNPHMPDLAQEIERLSQQLTALKEKTAKDLATQYAQLEALTKLTFALQPRFPLPPLRGWAASPDIALTLYTVIHALKPAFVVECGGGVSSLVIGYALEREGRGKLLS